MKVSMEVHSSSHEERRLRRKAIVRLAIYIFATMAISSLLLILNVGMVYTLFAGIAQMTVREAYAQKLGQFVMFVGPFLLLFPEWLVYDILVSPLRSKK